MKNLRLYTVLIVFIIFSSFIAEINNILPNSIYVTAGNENSFEFPPSVSISCNGKIISQKHGEKIKFPYSGKYGIRYDLFGVFPIKNAVVKAVDEIKVYPSGQNCGVKLITDGVLVISSESTEKLTGRTISPAKAAGLIPGDFITKFNDIQIKNTAHFSLLLQDNKSEKIKLTIRRGNNEFDIELSPVLSDNANYYIGAWVRDSTAGLGTLTFFTEDKKRFAALGHSITDSDTGEIMTPGSGELIKASVASLTFGKPGKPGEMSGIFDYPEIILGNITENNSRGLFGNVADKSEIGNAKPIPIGFRGEIKCGPAKILCSPNNKVEEYDINIEKILPDKDGSIKNMIIAVTDEKLIKLTGGIIQGMSGSPIIQNGKLVGAVTHVFVNNPLKGYGIFAENMLKETK